MRKHLSALADTLGLPSAATFEPSSRARERAGATSRRVVASALVSLTGLALLVPNLQPLVGPSEPLAVPFSRCSAR